MAVQMLQISDLRDVGRCWCFLYISTLLYLSNRANRTSAMQ